MVILESTACPDSVGMDITPRNFNLEVQLGALGFFKFKIQLKSSTCQWASSSATGPASTEFLGT